MKYVYKRKNTCTTTVEFWIKLIIKLALGGLSAFILFLLTWTCGCWEDEFDEYSADLAADIKSNKNRRV